MTQAFTSQPLQVKLLDPRFGDSWPLPAYATEASAGMDLRAALDTALTLQPGDTALVPSGLAAITLVDIALLKAGDHVLLPDNGYGPGTRFAREDLARWGITMGLYDAMDPASLAAAITPATIGSWPEV